MPCSHLVSLFSWVAVRTLGCWQVNDSLIQKIIEMKVLQVLIFSHKAIQWGCPVVCQNLHPLHIHFINFYCCNFSPSVFADQTQQQIEIPLYKTAPPALRISGFVPNKNILSRMFRSGCDIVSYICYWPIDFLRSSHYNKSVICIVNLFV